MIDLSISAFSDELCPPEECSTVELSEPEPEEPELKLRW